MTTYNELCTVADVRVEYLDPQGLTTNTDDRLILSFIRSLSAAATTTANHVFIPIIATYTYDVPPSWYLNPRSGIPRLYVNEDLLEVISLTNGDGSVVSSSDYTLYPLNDSVKHEIALKNTAGIAWQTGAGNHEGVISVRGVWGYHEDYGSAWLNTGATLQAAIDTDDTDASVETGLVRAGQLLKIGSEYLYTSAVLTGATDTLTVIRGANGSTAAAHLSSAAVYRWYQPALDALMRVAVAGQIRLRDNPMGESIRVGEAVFSTPKDVLRYIDSHLDSLGFTKVGMG